MTISAVIEGTSIWARTLAIQADDPYAPHREKLRVALTQMRENCIVLARQIQPNLPGLTVHDESHLDALWHTADLIAGPELSLTPLESFVFGGAVLLHDTALTLAAYPGGIDSLKATVEWQDEAANMPNPSDPEAEKEILFRVLRTLHAQQAEALANISFARPKTKEQIFLLSDPELRDAYGFSIGRIAHSHHWDASVLAERLQLVVGPLPGFPAEWKLNELKIACLLRTADAAHIDSRRAPTLLYAISQPSGTSQQHWEFQNKLHQVTRSADKLIFTSGSPFTAEQSSSWWLCHDTLKMVDREIKSCNAILSDKSVAPFAAKSVAGIESPQLLAHHIKASGWRPIDAAVHVSDPVHLARTLGGKNLYGDGIQAPIRELLQNAVDAVRARRLQEDRDGLWGRVRLFIEKSDEDIWLHVDDQGIGMSEAVLTGPLVDFGKSLWSSGLLQEEFPGLRSKRLKPIGKFGIGFFSVFLLGDEVRVISKKYNAGDAEARVLEFSNLTHRPLIRPCTINELPRDFSTRVSVKLKKYPQQNAEGRFRPYPFRVSSFTKVLVVSLDVEVEFQDQIANESWTHSADWVHTPTRQFLSELLPDESIKSEVIAAHEPLVTPIKDASGNIYGRAAIAIGTGPRHRASHGSYTSVGGFTYGLGARDLSSSVFFVGDYGERWMGPLSNYVGILQGETESAARNWARAEIPKEALVDWSTNQALLIKKDRFTSNQIIGFCQQVIELGGDPGDLPFCFCGGSLRNLREFRQVLRNNNDIAMPLESQDYKSKIDFRKISSLTTDYYNTPMRENSIVFFIDSHEIEFVDEDERKTLIGGGNYTLGEEDLKNLMNFGNFKVCNDILTAEWQTPIRIKIEHRQIFNESLFSAPANKLCMVIEKVVG